MILPFWGFLDIKTGIVIRNLSLFDQEFLCWFENVPLGTLLSGSRQGLRPREQGHRASRPPTQAGHLDLFSPTQIHAGRFPPALHGDGEPGAGGQGAEWTGR